MLQFIITNFEPVLIAVSGVVAGASTLAALTPTPIDDCFWAKIKKVIDILALNVGNAKPVTPTVA